VETPHGKGYFPLNNKHTNDSYKKCAQVILVLGNVMEKFCFERTNLVAGRTLLTNKNMAFSGGSWIRFRMMYIN